MEPEDRNRHHPPADPFEGAAVTALGLAASRSVETGQSDRLINDPLARELFKAAGAFLPMLLDWPDPAHPPTPQQALHLHGSRYIGLRTRFYDDELLSAARDGIGRAVLLGAGLDTRAHRLRLPPGFRLFEVDQGPLLNWKRAQLARLGARPRTEVRDVSADLREDWPASLKAAGHDENRPSLFLAEGLIPYLDQAEQARLLVDVQRLAAPGTRLACDRIRGDAASGGRLERLSRRSGIDMTGLIAGAEAHDLARLLADRGWETAELSARQLAERYGRDLSDPFPDRTAPDTEPPWLDTVFLTGAYSPGLEHGDAGGRGTRRD
jgi:methyltransferase (TIGR00027 family)